jgi:hypothetical protein
MKIHRMLLLLIFSSSAAFAQDTETAIRNYFYVEGTVFAGAQTQIRNIQGDYSERNEVLTGIGVGCGHKWFFTSGEKYRTGLSLTWLRAEGFKIVDGFGELNGCFAPLQPGWTNAWQQHPDKKLELNLSAGLTVQLLEERYYRGFQFSPELKLHSKRNLVAISYTYSNSTRPTNGSKLYASVLHQVRLTVGVSSRR